MVGNNKRFVIFSFISISAAGVFYFFNNYDFNFLISSLNSFINNVCGINIQIQDSSKYKSDFVLTNDLKCINNIVKIDEINKIFYIAKLSEGYLLVLKSLIIYTYSISFIISLIYLLKKEKTLKNLLDAKFSFFILFFVNFVFIRYFFIVLEDKSFIASSSISRTEFLNVNLVYIFGILIIYFLISKLQNKKILYILLTIFFTFPIFNFLGLYSNLYIPLILLISFFILKIINKDSFLKINIFFSIIISIQLFQVLTQLSSSHNGESFIRQIDSTFLNKNKLFEPSVIVESSFDNKYPPIIIFWFDELPANIVFNNSFVREEFPNLKNLSEVSYNFYKNVSLSGYSPYAIYEVFSNDLFNELTENYVIGTVENSTNICNFEFCNFKNSEFENSQNFTYFKDTLAIYLNLYSIELFQNFVPDITTKLTNFFDEKYNMPASFQDDKQLYSSYKSSEYLIKQISNKKFVFSHILLPHMPWRYSKEGSYYFSGESVLTSIFLGDIRDDSFLFWNEDYRSNSYYQNIEASRLIEQAIFMDKLLGSLISELKQNGKFDESLIIFTSDHGINFNPIKNARAASEENLIVYNTPLLIKLPYQNNSVDVREPTSHELISEIIFSLIKNISLQNTIDKHEPTLKVRVYEGRDTFKNSVDGYAMINLQKLENEIYNDLTFFNTVFDFYNENFGWKERNIDLENHVDITKDINIQLPILSEDSELEFKYIVFTTKLNLRKLIVKNKDKILEIQNINSKKNKYVFYLDKPITAKELEKLEFYIEK